MPHRFRAIGFRGISDEGGMRDALALAAERASAGPDNTLVCTPFDGCVIRIGLEPYGEPKDVVVSLRPLVQPVMFGETKELGNGETVVTGFTCLDGLPVSPIQFRCSGAPEDLQPGRPWFVELSGFAEGLKETEGGPDDVGFGRPDGERRLPVKGFIVRAARERNCVTDAPVTLATVWVPGLLLPISLPGDHEFAPGTKVEGQVRIYGEVAGGGD
ncbi:MAG: hypothetical protein IH851_09805 [Armatimonadetes bacterium]|nr:hypothetical protein [Armatimonadota bacterium]